VTPQPLTLPRLVSAASEPYRAAGRLAYHFARGKLQADPVFEAILARGLLERSRRILDLGCGQGLLAAWLIAAHGDAPRVHPWVFRGIDSVGRYVERARRALGNAAEFIEADVRGADFGSADGIVILDVLHYIEYADQRRLLEKVHRALVPGGVLLLRVGDADGGFGFKVGTWVDRMVLLASGRGLQQLHCRSTAQWRELLSSLGFDSDTVPMSAGTPFANVLLVARPRSASPR
jgi:SAM-dependent methyltransferase